MPRANRAMFIIPHFRDLIRFNPRAFRTRVMKKSGARDETRNDKTYFAVVFCDIIRARNEIDFPWERYNVGSFNPRVSRGDQRVKNNLCFRTILHRGPSLSHGCNLKARFNVLARFTRTSRRDVPRRIRYLIRFAFIRCKLTAISIGANERAHCYGSAKIRAHGSPDNNGRNCEYTADTSDNRARPRRRTPTALPRRPSSPPPTAV